MTTAALPEPAPLDERGPVDAETFAREIVPAFRPVVLRGQVADWSAVTAPLGHEPVTTPLVE